MAQLESKQAGMRNLAVAADRRVAEIEESISNMRVVDQASEQTLTIAEEEEEDRQGAETALEQELATVKALQDLVKDIQLRLMEQSPEQMVTQTQNNFGSYNYGVQMGENTGTMNNSFGGGGRCP